MLLYSFHNSLFFFYLLLVTAQSANSLKFHNEKNLSLICYYYSDPLRIISYLLEGFSTIFEHFCCFKTLKLKFK